jgi:predicted transcriptional regulator
MNNSINFKLNSTAIENLNIFSEILRKDHNMILNEALEQYFENEQQKLIEKNQEDESVLTNLDYDEFWSGVDI